MAEVEDVRLVVYRAFADTGRPPTLDELTATCRGSLDDVRDALRTLHDQRLVVVDTEANILMAHPFTTVPMGFSVMGETTLWWGGCAWDAFAVPHLVPSEPNVLVATTCPACARPLAWNIAKDAPPPPNDCVAHFLTPTQHMWDDVLYTCSNQRLFCNDACVDAWGSARRLERGYTMDTTVLWKLASHWYDGRLDPGYQRREPSQAAAYFREAGLRGSFWGLPD
jgi:hypothetical protein